MDDDKQDARRQIETYLREYQELYYLIAKTPIEWPPLQFNWDFRPSSQCFALDELSQEAFVQAYPKGLSLGWVDLAEFDEELCPHNFRTMPEDLWSGDRLKLARVVAHLSESRPITPILALPHEDGDIRLLGGNHRYAAFKAWELPEIPIYVEAQRMDSMRLKLPVRRCPSQR